MLLAVYVLGITLINNVKSADQRSYLFYPNRYNKTGFWNKAVSYFDMGVVVRPFAQPMHAMKNFFKQLFGVQPSTTGHFGISRKVNDTSLWGKTIHTIDKAIISRSPLGLVLQAMDSFLNRFIDREIRAPWVKPFENKTAEAEPEAGAETEVEPSGE